MKVLMFGWEFPPHISGGLGTACFGLTKALVDDGDEVTFVLPHLPGSAKSHVKLVSATRKGTVRTIEIESTLHAYADSKSYRATYASLDPERRRSLYGKNLAEEVERYAHEAERIAREEEHDIIHAHDWLTYKAGIAAARVSGKPLIVHVHATEYDRTGGSPDPAVRAIEFEGVHAADHVIAVSNYTKSILTRFYELDHTKISVVHNGYDAEKHCSRKAKNGPRNVLFLGRLTLQKGPEYFLRAARKVLDHVPDAHFIVAGDGDMFTRSVHLAADLGIANHVSFTGFLSGPDISRAYELAQLYVMPSVSEPFGITALEAIGNSTPVVLSKQSGVSEVVNHALKVDFWDTDKLAHQICSVLEYPCLRDELMECGLNEIRSVTWSASARKVRSVYSQMIARLRVSEP
jgi:glycogen synthase